MKVTVNSAQPSRKLVAVIGIDGGVFLPKSTLRSVYLSPAGTITAKEQSDLGSLLLEGPSRKPVFEGDTVTLQF